MIHIWLPNPQAPLRVWQDTTQTWQTADNWQEVATLASLQNQKNKQKLACLYFPSLSLLRIQPDLTAPQLKALGDSGRQYLFEDISIGSVEDLQIKSTQSANQPTTLYALHASDRDAWLNTAHLAGLEIVALVPDFLLLPSAPLSNASENDFDSEKATAVFYQDEATQLLKINTANTNAPQGMAVSHLPILLSKLPNVQHLVLCGQIAPNLLDELALLPPIKTQISDSLPVPAVDATRHWLNFAQVKRDNKVPPYAKVIAAVFISALLCGLLVDGLRWYHYQKAEAQAKSVLKQQYEQWFPDSRYNPRLGIQKQLSGRLVDTQSASTNVLTTLASIQPVLRQYQINARQVNYQNNRLQLQLVAKDSDSLTKAVNAISAQGVNAKLGAVNPDTAGAIGAVEISL